MLGDTPSGSPEALRPVTDQLLDGFGPRRLIWGSDWPVLTLAGGYGDWVRITGELLGGLGDAARAMVWGGNAERIYRLASGEGRIGS